MTGYHALPAAVRSATSFPPVATVSPGPNGRDAAKRPIMRPHDPTREETMPHRIAMSRRAMLRASAAALATTFIKPSFAAGEPLKIGLIIPLTGPFASTGKQLEAACRLYMQKNGDTVAGRKVDLIVKDDTGVAPETTKRLAQELVVQEKVSVLAGFGLTPLALAAAPVATQSKTPMIVMAAATSIITTKSPYIVRSGFTLPQVTWPIAEWAPKNGIKSAVALVSDYAPGLDAEKTFVSRFTAAGGKVLDSLRVPLRNPDYAPFLQRTKDAKPDALFVFVPAGEGSAVMKQFNDRGLKEAGIRMIGTGDVVDDDLLESMGSVAVGVVTSFHYSAAHDSPENKAYVDAFMKTNHFRPNFHSVGGYDGMHVIYEALKKAGAGADGDKIVEAMKGLAWTSPRGPITIDSASRDPIQTVYIRRVEMVDGKPWSIEFAKFENVKDPGV
jgi:branched-chain amino acid transport system substrate-binding protein